VNLGDSFLRVLIGALPTTRDGVYATTFHKKSD
jgi:hypothetical protein